MIAAERALGKANSVWARGVCELVECDAGPVRADIASRYLGAADRARFAVERESHSGVLLRLTPVDPRVWDLSGILPV